MSKYSCSIGDPLDLLAEECAEVIKERIKALRFGLNGCKEWIAAGKLSPRDNIVQEIGDLLVVIDMLKEKGFCTEAELQLAKEKKLARIMALYGETK